MYGPPNSALTKADYAYMRLRERILTGDLEPGSPLDQVALAATLDVSTTPLREALRRLESERLVVSRAHRDTIVAPIDFALLEEVSIVRIEMEPLGIRLACSAATDAELASIAQFAQDRPAGDDPFVMMQYNGEIHRRIYRAGHNVTLIRMLDSLSDLVDRYRAMALRAEPDRSHDHENHTEIMAAMLARDTYLAAKLMREHIEFGFHRMRLSQPSAPDAPQDPDAP